MEDAPLCTGKTISMQPLKCSGKCPWARRIHYLIRRISVANIIKSLVTKSGRKVNVRRDTVDFRDKMYVPTLIEVPSSIDIQEYRSHSVPVLDQGMEGACTGFGLATVVNYLLRRRNIFPDTTGVSPWMLYKVARRYDEWPGEAYEGSSARGAMKGWHKHGVCAETLWSKEQRLTHTVSTDAATRPLGAYYRVNHRDLVAIHSAIAEVGILYATAIVHAGWEEVGADGIVPLRNEVLGGHAFAIVAYNERGFWIQNSWGDKWGNKGFAHVCYDDWLANGTDVWVARLGAPVSIQTPESVAVRNSASTSYTDAFSNSELRQHIISIGNDGLLNDGGQYGTSKEDVEYIFKEYFPAVTKNWKKKRILLYAHGGMVSESSAVQLLADYRPALLQAEVYPVSFIWHSDFLTTILNILKDAAGRRRPEGFLDEAMNFMLDRLDDALEPIARMIGGKNVWDEMKENALCATTNAQGGARIAMDCLDQIIKNDPKVEVHIVGHSAGSIFHAPLIDRFTGHFGHTLTSCTLWAPACTVELFGRFYLPAITSKKIGRFALFTLTDKAEQDDNCCRIYNKSLLYMVSNAFEEEPRIPLYRDGEPLIGMEKFVLGYTQLMDIFRNKAADWITSPNTNSSDVVNYSTARHHGDFDNDEPTVRATLARVLGADRDNASGPFKFSRSASALREKRLRLLHS